MRKGMALAVLLVGLAATIVAGDRVVNEKLFFAAIGDYGNSGQPESQVRDIVNRWAPDFVITLGDNNYPRGYWANIDANIGQYYADYIRPYNGNYTTNPTIKKNRYWPSLGNHDWYSAKYTENAQGVRIYDGGDSLPYVRYFKGVLPPGPTGYGRYYDFVKGPVHFIVVDSHPYEPDGVSADSKQGQWVKSVLARSTSPHRIVYFHHTPYCSKANHVSPWMRWPFVEWGATLIMNGHVHFYERLEVKGLLYLLNGLGGTPNIYAFDVISNYSQFRYNTTWGAQRVSANSTHLAVTFVNIYNTAIETVYVPARAPKASPPQPFPSVREAPTIILLVVSIIALVGFGGMFAYRSLVRKPEAPEIDEAALVD